MFEEPVPGLAGQRERAVLLVGDARVPHGSPVLLEVGLLRHAAGPVHGRAGAPDNSLLQSLSVKEMRVEKRCGSDKGMLRGSPWSARHVGCQSALHGVIMGEQVRACGTRGRRSDGPEMSLESVQ